MSLPVIQPWTDEESDALLALRETNLTVAKIAEALVAAGYHKRSRNSIIGRIDRLRRRGVVVAPAAYVFRGPTPPPRVPNARYVADIPTYEQHVDCEGYPLSAPVTLPRLSILAGEVA